MSGEQFALPEAVERLQETQRTSPSGGLITICAVDPLNLTGIVTAGIVTAGERIRASAAGRVVFKDGIPIAALEGERMRALDPDGCLDLIGRRQRADRAAPPGRERRVCRPGAPLAPNMVS